MKVNPRKGSGDEGRDAGEFVVNRVPDCRFSSLIICKALNPVPVEERGGEDCG